MDAIDDVRPFETKDWPVLRVEEGGFRVLSGFRLSRKGRRVTVDWFGWRIQVSLMRQKWPLQLHCFWDKPPRDVWLMIWPLDISFSPAYSGVFASEDENG